MVTSNYTGYYGSEYYDVYDVNNNISNIPPTVSTATSATWTYTPYLTSALDNKQLTIKETRRSILYLFTGHDSKQIFAKFDKESMILREVTKAHAKAILDDKEEEYLAMENLRK